jgi:hypothetical protein
MKLTVNRQLAGGIYFVSFNVSDFTPEEIQKMESFGVPSVGMMLNGPGNRSSVVLSLNRIAPAHRAAFSTDEEAEGYVDGVVRQVREAIAHLRLRTDDFTSSSEVDI